MFITLSNGRKFVIHYHYTTLFKQKTETDEYGRTVNTTWFEHDTKTSIYEWFEDKPGNRITFEGLAHCSYKDKYNKRYGRDLSFVKVLMEMKFQKQISKNELWEIAEKVGFKENKRLFFRAWSKIIDEEE